MEEILASIRKIISEDSNEAPAPAGAAAAPESHDADVLELTQEVVEEAPPAPEPVRAAAPPAPEPIKPDDIEIKSVEEPAPVAQDDDIFSDKTRKALEDSFGRIPQAVEPAPAPAAAPAPRNLSVPDGSSVEAVFARAVSEAFDPVLHQWMAANKGELMTAVKPLIREWMDAHFPALLEGAVRNEVERVVKARGGK
ncbi:MAG: DUF2497 domain-containing protein [Proteobacteria bacterium]|nr:DUF2497 domain-containing protein [Pseudomonadota bacterium]